MSIHHEQEILKRNAELERELAVRNRALDIEAALEKVRSRANAMHRSEHLHEVIIEVNEQLRQLGFRFDGADFLTDYSDKGYNIWVANFPTPVYVPAIDHKLFNLLKDVVKRGDDFFTFTLTKEEKDIHFKNIFENTIAKNAPDELKQYVYDAKGMATSCVVLGNINLSVTNFASIPYTDAENEILKRFAKVFEQSYTRFLDLQKAEAQAREAQIEAALERVRARAMAMHKSDQLLDAGALLYNELSKLGITKLTSGYMLIDEGEEIGWNYGVNPATGQLVSRPIGISLTETRVLKAITASWKKQEPLHVIQLDPEETIAHQTYMAENAINFPISKEQLLAISPERLAVHTFNFKHGFLLIVGGVLLTKEQQEMVVRFAKVFEMTYRRFLDLQQAEAQAREAQIEAGLERVRSRSLGMHNTSELQDVIHAVHKELLNLNIAIHGGSFIAINRDINTKLSCWGSGGTANTSEEVHLPFYDKPFCTNLISRIKSAPGFFTEEYTQEEKKDFFTFLLKYEPWSKLDAKQKKEILSSPGGYTRSCCVSQHTSIFIINHFGEKFSAADNDVLQRFGTVFEQTYTRFNDLKQAEAQARESQIQLALERVRARTMAMQHSDELKNAAALLFQQVKSLGAPAYSCGYNIWEKDDKVFTSWMSTQDGSIINGVPDIPLTEDANFTRYVESKQNGEQFFVLELRGERMQEHYQYLKTIPAFKAYFEYALSVGFDLPETQIHHLANFSHGNLLFITLEPCPEFHDVFKRFAAVFEQTYTRFLDLQNAEALAKESQIQLALERVRARTMAMQKSDELAETASLLFKQISDLGIQTWTSGFNIWEKDDTSFIGYNPTPSGEIATPYHIPSKGDSFFNNIYQAKKRGEEFLVFESSGDSLVQTYTYMKSLPVVKDVLKGIEDSGFLLPAFQINHCAFFSHGFLLFITLDAYSEAYDIFKRFAKVFEQTYTRFLDLQKAEAQAREAQIEAALEKVRSRSLAMHTANELGEVVTVIVEKLKDLGVVLDANGVVLCTYFQHSKDVMHWIVSPDYSMAGRYLLPYFDHPIFNDAWQSRESGDEYFSKSFSVEEKNSFFKYAFEHSDYKYFPEDFKQWIFQNDKHILSFAWQKNSAILIPSHTGVLPTESDKAILIRFAKVFEQSFVRFLDLQKAEAQARESQIQLALERVRARTMAMQKSDELPQAANLLFQQVQSLGMPAWSAGYCIWDDDKNAITLSMSSEGVLQPTLRMPLTEDPSLKHFREAYEKGESFFVDEVGGEALKEHYTYLRTLPGVKETLDDIERAGFPVPTFQIFHLAYFTQGFLLFITYESVPESHDIFKRFAKVFEQTYTRFLDLQKSEAQARESQIQLALERVRARTMAMQKSDELPETSLLLFQQVKELGETTVQNSIGIVNQEAGFVELSTTVHGHHLPHTLNVPIDDPYVMAKAVAAWKAKRRSLKLKFEGQELKNYNEHRNSFFETKVNFPEHQWIVNIIFFSKGWLSFSSDKNISDATFDLLKRFAAVFEQTYIRFNDLKQAEEQARESQIQLALERVRARTMAMQKSDELMETAVVLFDQLKQLGENIERTIIGVMNEEERGVDVWATRPDGSQMEKMQKFPIDEPVLMQKVYEAWRQQKRSIVIDLQGKELETYFQFLKSRGPKLKRENFGERRVENFAFFSKGMLGFINVDPNKPANVGLYERFAAVFDQTYKRFLDLQKAEAQAREAQIEAALERVRSRSMGMQKSEELKEVIQVVYEQFVHLNINVEHTGFVMDYKTRDDYYIWIADPLGVPSQVTIPYFDCVYYNRFNEAKKKGEDFFTSNLDFEEKNRFYQKIIEYVPGLPEESKEFLFSIPGLAASTVLLDNVCLYIENFSGTPYSDEENKTLMRFGKVFQQTYTRFLDLQKAEAQAREAQIEASLERIRSRTMGMQKSNELKDVATLLNRELILLGINNFASCGYIEIEEKSNRQHSWLTNPEGVSLEHFFLPLTGEHIFDERYDAWKRKDVVFKQVVHAKELKKHLDFAYSGFGSQESENIGRNFFPDPTIFYSCNFSYGYLSLITGVMLSQAEELLLARFTRVFEQTYSRFLDLQKAEAQAREAKIETALEKVRASTMAMQHSDHLSETAFVLFKQFKELGEAPERIFIATFDNEQDGIIDIWGTNQGGNQLNKLFKVSAEEPTVISKIITAWKEKKRSLVIDLKGEELKQYISFLRSTGMPVVEGIMEERRVQTIGCFSKGVIGVTTPEPQSAESVQLLERFAGVFDLTYTRFLDLQQAEAQAREAKIEAALERVRSRTMAMQHSNELKDAALLLFQQVQSFGVDQWACGYNIWEADGKTCMAWMSRQGGLQPPFKTHPAVDHCFQRFYDAKQRGESFYVDEIGGEEIKTHYKRLISLPEFRSAPKEFFDEFIAPEFQIFHIAYFEQGYLMFITYKPVPDTWDIFKRFAKVFEQTYTRFLDLQKAEAQAREAKIEAALEKVRSRTMAMQTSAELTDVAGLLFEQVSALDIKTWTAGFNVWSEDNNSYVDYITSPQGGFIEPYTVYTETAEALTDISNARKSGVEFDVQFVEGEKIKQLYLALTKLDEKQYEIMLQDGVRFPSHQYEHFVFGSKVSLMFITYEPVPEAHDIFKRLGKVFEQTYTRFLDLQKAEAQAREVIKQASVDRVRAEIASMRTTNDLERIQPLIWNELTTLGVPFTRCGVFILDDEHEQVETFLSTPEGRSIASFTSNYSDVAVITGALPYWRKKEIYKAHWDEATFLAQAQTLLSQGNITSTETYLTEHHPQDLYLHFLPFLQGILYVGNETPLKEDELQLVQNLADAFSIAYARYEDFNKLELAKEQIENTLTNLKQAQAQLVQSEKMASLGELTAGIAHEIQNPLNFVNNFSEVNTELIAEMKEEIDKGNVEEAKAIAKDIAENEQKINHHGKRADAIVKGMLQHSRSSSGVKEPSDINVLADEYLRLAYHGLRAKDKSFNATMKTDFDESIGKINIVPQDVGRSVLNLITNAFYAVSEKKKEIAESLRAGAPAKPGYQPTVTVTTKRIKPRPDDPVGRGKVEIRVADNGNGIPQKVLDKIFQPFFTTKPTGQGTGLGLSLSYDIIKAHNGELTVATNEGEGSEFIILLPANN